MYIGGGLLGLILVVVLFVWLLRRVWAPPRSVDPSGKRSWWLADRPL